MERSNDGPLNPKVGSRPALLNVAPMPPPILIRPLLPSDLAAWKPLWAGYNAFYGRVGDTALAPEITTRRTVVRASKRDSVSSLAQRYRLSASSVAEWNNLKPGDMFKAGQKVVLHLPITKASQSARPSKSQPQRRGGKPSRKKR